MNGIPGSARVAAEDATPDGTVAESLSPPVGPAISPALQRIVLTGFMGAGKSTVGRLLARQLGWPFVDADDVIEASVGITVAEIFRQQGEKTFRDLEQNTIQDLLSRSPLVLALGGGAIEHESTRQSLLNSPGTQLIYLEASLETVLARCGDADTVRPVLADRANLESRFLKRLPLYRNAHQTVAVDHLAPADVVQAILGVISQAR